MTRITEILEVENQEDPFDVLDLTPDTLNTVSDAELDDLREAIQEIWRTQGSREDDDGAIGASIVVNNAYKLRKRKLPKKDKLDEIAERFEKTAITGEEEKVNPKEKFINELKELFAKSLPEYDLVIKKKEGGE